MKMGSFSLLNKQKGIDPCHWIGGPYIELLISKQDQIAQNTKEKRRSIKLGHNYATQIQISATNRVRQGGGIFEAAAVLISYGFALLQNITKGLILVVQKAIKMPRYRGYFTSLSSLYCLIATISFQKIS